MTWKNGRKENVVLYLVNGIGDVLMAYDAVNDLVSKCTSPRDIVVTVRGSQQAKIIKSWHNEIDVLIDNGGLFSRLKTFLIFARMKAFIIAPMVSPSIFNCIYFWFIRKVTYLPAGFENVCRTSKYIRVLNIRFGAGQIHQVDYLRKFCNMAMSTTNNRKNSFDNGLGSYLPYRENDNAIKNIVVSVCCSPLEVHKIPSIEYFSDLISLISQKIRCNIIIFGAESDRDRLERLEKLARSKNSDFILNKIIVNDVLSTINLLKLADVGVAGTVGQGHMMAVAGLPLVVLYGVTNIHESGPYAKRVVGIRHQRECGPCYQPAFQYGCGKHQCMDEISQDEIVLSVKRLLRDNESCYDWYSALEFKNTRTREQIVRFVN